MPSSFADWNNILLISDVRCIFLSTRGPCIPPIPPYPTEQTRNSNLSQMKNINHKIPFTQISTGPVQCSLIFIVFFILLLLKAMILSRRKLYLHYAWLYIVVCWRYSLFKDIAFQNILFSKKVHSFFAGSPPDIPKRGIFHAPSVSRSICKPAYLKSIWLGHT